MPPAVPSVPLGSSASTKTPMAIPIAMSIEVIVMPCSRNSVHIFLVNEVSLFKTVVILFLKLVIWLVSLRLRRLILSA